MIFKNKYKDVKEIFEKEVPFLKKFLEEFLSNFENVKDVIDKVFDDTTIAFDDVFMPYKDGTLKECIDEIRAIKKEYNDPKNEYDYDIKCKIERLDTLFKNSHEANFTKELYDLIFVDSLKTRTIKVADDIKKLRKIIIKAYAASILLSLMDDNGKEITFYVKNNNHDNKLNFIYALAHEMFHQVYYGLKNKRFTLDNFKTIKYKENVLNECLATYFGIEYLKYRGYNDMANYLYEFYSKNSIIYMPHAGIKTINEHNKGEIIKESFNDIENSLTHFLEPYEIDIIKRKNKTHNKISNIKESQLYIFRDKSYFTPDLVYEIVSLYVDDYKPSLYELAKNFPDNLQGPLGVFQLEKDLKKNYNEEIINLFFCPKPITVENESILICCFWPPEHSFKGFTRNAKRLGYIIKQK